MRHSEFLVDGRMYYSIFEVASAIERNTSTLRFWEIDLPWVAPARRNRAGRRMYTSDEFIRMIDVNYLLGCGLSIDGVNQAYGGKYLDDLVGFFKGNRVK